MAKKKPTRKPTALERGIAYAQRKIARSDDRVAERYMILCNLIETLWANRNKKDFYKVNYTRLMLLTSPQAREISMFIDSLYWDECWKAEEYDLMQEDSDG